MLKGTAFNPETNWPDAAEFTAPEAAPQPEMTSEAWQKYIDHIRQEIAAGSLEKAVASRVHFQPGTVVLKNAFLSACAAHPGAFVCLLFHPVYGCWLQASPELLLSTDPAGNMKTVALAGTLLPGSEEWTGKEQEENLSTARYISEILGRFGVSPDISSPRGDYPSGELRHLVQHFSFSQNPAKLTELLEALHPTPAVAGVPREQALHIIAAHEPHQRQLYTGWTGVALPDGFRSFVHLRCARITPDGAWLYAGAGINAGSVAEAEWDETASKMQVIGRCLLA